MQNLAKTPQQMGAILLRKGRKLKRNQGELGEKAGLWQKTISRIENGAPGTKLATLFDLISALDLELIVMPRSKGKVAHLEDVF